MEPETSAAGAPSVSAMMDQLWAKFLPQIEERVALLEQAVTALAAGELKPELRDQAHSAAHKLAGTLGMFGLEQGTELAREAENLLDPESQLDAAGERRVAEIVNQIQSIVRSRC